MPKGVYERSKEYRERIRQKLRPKRLGEMNPMYGRRGKYSPRYGIHLSEETKEKLRRVKLGKLVGNKNPFYGKHHSEETKEKIRQKKLGQHHSDEAKRKIGSAQLGEKHHNWKGGRYVRDGYVMVKVENHPYANRYGYVLEHRLVMEKELGRYLKPTEVVNHRNGIRSDNRYENLELFENHSTHIKMHLATHFPWKPIVRTINNQIWEKNSELIYFR